MKDTALKKILKELATGEPILVFANQQKKYLRKIAEQAEQKSGVELGIATRSQGRKEVELPVLRVRIKSEDNGNYEYDSFYLGFTPKDKTLYISTQRNFILDLDYADRKTAFTDVDQLPVVIEEIRKIQSATLLKERKQQVAESFTRQGVKAVVIKAAKQFNLMYAIDKTPKQYLIFLRKPKKTHVVVIKIAATKKLYPKELEQLPELVEHAAGHLEFCHKVYRCISVPRDLKYNRTDWQSA